MSAALDIAVCGLAIGSLAGNVAWPVLLAAGRLRASSCGCAVPVTRRARVIPAAAVTALPVAGEAMTRRDAAALLGVGERDVRALGKAGVLAERPQGGRATLVTSESVERLRAAAKPPEPQGAVT
jgi:hypothetical protein